MTPEMLRLQLALIKVEHDGAYQAPDGTISVAVESVKSEDLDKLSMWFGTKKINWSTDDKSLGKDAEIQILESKRK